MNNIDDMWSTCHDCPYWEICEPPYVCEATIEKQNKTVYETDYSGGQYADQPVLQSAT